jgi:TATA-box binding protein (TBP) (component of TFIID and TFIIIB)
MCSLSQCKQFSQSNKRWTITNSTFTAKFNCRMPYLNFIAERCQFKYNPKRLNAVIISQYFQSKGTILLFESGSIVIVGVQSKGAAKKVGKLLEKKLCDVGIRCRLRNFCLKNMVARVQLDPNFIKRLWGLIDCAYPDTSQLRECARKLGILFMYEPELFSSAKFISKEPKGTVCVFRSGAGIVTGFTKITTLRRIVKIVENL